jgi:uncharacterized protein (TIGR03067 family)
MHIDNVVIASLGFKALLCAGFVALAAMTAGAADVPDSKAVQGLWRPLKADLGGQPMTEDVLKMITLRLKDDRYVVSVGGQLDKGTCTVDSSTQPKGMTIIGTEGPNQGKKFPAIFEVEGDTLRVCYDLSGKRRPAEFKSLAGTQLYLVTYHRAKE